MPLVPKNYVNCHSSEVFTKATVPERLLQPHVMQAGIYGQIQVLNGTLKYYGLRDRQGAVLKEIILKANETAISHPEFWHKLELLTDDTEFRINFYAHKDSTVNHHVFSR